MLEPGKLLRDLDYIGNIYRKCFPPKFHRSQLMAFLLGQRSNINLSVVDDEQVLSS